MNESRRAVARVYVCALHRIWCKCGVQQVLFVYGAPRGVTLAEDTCLPALRARPPQPHAPYCSRPPGALVQRRSRALRPYPSRILWARVVQACHSLLARHTRALTLAPVESPTGEDSKPNVSSVHGVGFTNRNHVSAPDKIHNPVQRIHNPMQNKSERPTANRLPPLFNG